MLQSAEIAYTANTHFALFLLSERDIRQCSEQHSMQLTNLKHPAGVFEVNSCKQSCLKIFKCIFHLKLYTLHNTAYIHNELLVFLFFFFCFLLLFTNSCPQKEKQRKERMTDKNKVKLKENYQIKKGNVFKITAD